MRILKSLTLAAGLLLAACGQPNGALKPVKTTEAQLDKLVDKLSTESFRGKDKIATDLPAVVAALPKAVAVTWASLDFEAASGATVLKTVKITPADNTAVGVSIDTLKLWDFDADLAKARLAGQRLTETAPLASRIDASNVRAFGLDTLMKPALDAYTDAVVDTAQQITREVDPTLEQAIRMETTKYDFSLGRLILDGVVLRPWELKPVVLPADNAMAEVMPMLQGYAAATRAVGFNAAVMLDMKGDLAFKQDGQESSMTMGIEKIAYRGWRGWDADLGVIAGMSYDMDLAMPVPPAPVVVDPGATAPPPAPVAMTTMAMDQSVARAVIKDMRLDKLAGYLARGEMPPRTETDLLSLGVMRFDDMKVSMSDAPLYSLGTFTIDLANWHWLIPNAGRISFDNLVYDVPGIVKFVQTTAAQAAPEAAAQMQMPPGLMEALAKHGLDKPSLDSALFWNWNTTSGATSVDLAAGLDAWTRFDLGADVTLPAFKPLSDLFPETGAPDEKKMEELFRQTFRFVSAEANLVDEGGLDKGFALASELGKFLPDAPEMAAFKNMSPEQIRGMASSGAYLGADTAGQQFPPARDLLRPFAEWITSGGKVHVVMKPKQPLSVANLEAGGQKPEDMVALFGLSVTHSGGKAKPKS